MTMTLSEFVNIFYIIFVIIFFFLQENHKFLWSVEDVSEAEKSWDLRLAKKYYDKLFKEYCIADLSQYEKNRVAMRWRTEMEVKSGKGQFVCGEKHCNNDKGLESWEVSGFFGVYLK